LYYKIKV